MGKELLVKKIVDAEWDMFDKVQNIGGRAACQDDRRMFYVFRESQFLAWDMPSLESYFQDLSAARDAGKNLVEYKYAYMMRETDRQYFEKIEKLLPTVPDGNLEIIENLIRTHLKWTKEMYDATGAVGRKLTSRENTVDETSYETYLRGELMTYSHGTLLAYQSYVDKLEEDNINLSFLVAKNQATLIGNGNTGK